MPALASKTAGEIVTLDYDFYPPTTCRDNVASAKPPEYTVFSPRFAKPPIGA